MTWFANVGLCDQHPLVYHPIENVLCPYGKGSFGPFHPGLGTSQTFFYCSVARWYWLQALQAPVSGLVSNAFQQVFWNANNN